MKMINSLERSYNFDSIESFKSCLSIVSFLYTKQFNQSTASLFQVERIDETVGTISFNIGKEMEKISLLESP